MLLRIEKGSAAPISRQIADQIATLCAAGKLRAGDQLPSVRELARELAVNQNTVLRVYERLCGAGLLEMRHGQGTFVSAEATGSIELHRARLIEELRQIGRQAIGLGLSSDDLHQLLAEAIAQLGAESNATSVPSSEEASE